MNAFYTGVALLALLGSQAIAQEWTRFRGPNGTGVDRETAIPAQWEDRHYRWRAELPGQGHSSPVLWDARLFLTGAAEDGSKFELYGLNADTGAILWQRSLIHHGFSKHRFNTFASSSPTVDAERVYVCHAVPERCLVTAFTHEGELVWQKDLGPYESQHGYGPSPILLGDRLIVGNDQKGESFLVALNPRNGEVLWKTPRASNRASYSTPGLVEDRSGRTLLLFNSQASGITAIDPADGSPVWAVPTAFDKRTVSSPFSAGGLVLGSCGSGGGGNYLIAITPPATGASQPKVKYRLRRSAPYVPTSIAVGDRLFTWSDAGIVSRLDLADGMVHWQERVGGRYFGSPVCAGDRLFCVSDRGEVVVVAASDAFEVLGRNDLGEQSHATPAIARGCMYVRTLNRVLCVGGE